MEKAFDVVVNYGGSVSYTVEAENEEAAKVAAQKAFEEDGSPTIEAKSTLSILMLPSAPMKSLSPKKRSLNRTRALRLRNRNPNPRRSSLECPRMKERGRQYMPRATVGLSRISTPRTIKEVQI